SQMSNMRDRWLNSQYKVMIDFIYDFLKGRFDKHLRDMEERERAKTQPSGNKVWEYLNRLERSYEEWDLGECGHPPGSCQSKWSKYLQTRLHQVERVEPEKFLFIYFKLGIKLSREEANSISQQYRVYDMTWRNGVLKYYHKKVNLRVETRRAEKESEDRRKRERERNQASTQINDDPPSMEEEDVNDEVADQPPAKRSRSRMVMEGMKIKTEAMNEEQEAPNVFNRILMRGMKDEPENEDQVGNNEDDEEEPERKPDSPFLRMLLLRKVNNTSMPTVSVSSQEIKEEPPDEAEMTSGESRRNGRDGRREMVSIPDERRNGDGEEQSIDSGERREDASTVPPTDPVAPAEGGSDAPPSIQPSPNVRRNIVSPKTIQAIWDEMTGENMNEGDREKERRKKELPVATTPRRCPLIDGEMGDTVAAIYEQVPTHSGTRGEFETVESTHAEMGLNATSVSEKTRNEGEREEERMEEDRTPVRRKMQLRPRVLHGRLSPAELVARIDRPMQQKRAAAASADFAGFRRRSKAGQEALLQAAVDVHGEDGESETAGQESPKKKKSKEIHCLGSGSTLVKRTPATVSVPIKSTEGAVANPLNCAVPSTSKPVESAAAQPVDTTVAQPSNSPATAATNPVEVQQVELMKSGDGIRWDRMRERLLERMNNKRREMEKKTKVEKTVTLLNSSNRLSSLCENRAAVAALITEDEEMSVAVLSDLLDGEDNAERRVSMTNDVYRMNIQEDPEAKERLRIKLYGDMAVDRLKKTMTTALEDDSLWE
ncbi:hypothetical protein PRIPAC_83462, partial [Pristionchus pacificus]